MNVKLEINGNIEENSLKSIHITRWFFGGGPGTRTLKCFTTADFKSISLWCNVIITTIYEKMVAIILPHSAPYTQPLLAICITHVLIIYYSIEWWRLQRIMFQKTPNIRYLVHKSLSISFIKNRGCCWYIIHSWFSGIIFDLHWESAIYL